jgi:hypothetical protein
MISYNPNCTSDKDKARMHIGWEIAREVTLPSMMSSYVTRNVWSPIAFKNGHRKQINFLRADFLALDFENENFPLSEAIKVFSGMIHFIGTTRNHQILKGGKVMDRFRVVIKFDRPITDLSVYRYNLSKAIKHYQADNNCKDGARPFFPCREVVSVSDKGISWPVSDEKERMFDPDKYYKRYERSGIFPPFVHYFLSTEIPIGDRNSHCYGFAKDLTRLNYSEKEIIDLILRSKTYASGCSSEVREDIEKAVRNGIKDAS